MTPEEIFVDDRISAIEEDFSPTDANLIKQAMLTISDIMLVLGPEKAQIVIKLINETNDRFNAET